MAKLLTHNEEAFCQAYADGLSVVRAYEAAYKKPGQNFVITEKVSKQANYVFLKPKIKERVKELQMALGEKKLWTREQSVGVLSQIALLAEKDADKIRAVTELNKMHGFYAPTKVDLSNSDGTLQQQKLDFEKLQDSTLLDLLNAANGK